VQILAVLGIVYGVYGYWIFNAARQTGVVHKLHIMILILMDLAMLFLMAYLVKELGYESVVIARMATTYLPIVFWAAATVLLFWVSPFWKPLSSGRVRLIVIVVLGLAAVVWLTQPWRVKIINRPVVFLQQDGVTVNWGTNMPAANLLRFGDTADLEAGVIPQTHGLIDVGAGVQRVFLPRELTGSLYLQATSVGVRRINPTSAIKAGEDVSERIQVNFPQQGDELFLVAISDIHEQTQVYAQQAKHIPWVQVDYAIFLGDFINHVDDAEQVAKAILGLPTGGVDLPRIFVRGNHEARGESARAFSDWLLPTGGKWYYTFSSGNTFIVVLDTGEDKPDSHVEYAELINFEAYHQDQAQWLAEVFASEAYQNAPYRVVLMHIPPFEHYTPLFAEEFQTDTFDPVLELLETRTDIDLVMSGHIHRAGIWLPEETGLPFPVTTCGGPLGIDTAAVTAHLTETGIQLEIIDILGNKIESAWFSAE
jgi:predicted phosphodiesterase